MRTSFWTKLLDVVSPRSCPVCGRRLSPGEQVLCAACHLHLSLTHFERSPLDNPMARLFWGQFPVERAVAYFFYYPQAPHSQLIYDLKYHSMPEIGEALGGMAARMFAAQGFFDGIDVLLPVPITRRRQWQRGYNQSHMIAKGVRAVTGLPIYYNVLRRVSFKQSQTTQHARERMLNVEDAFCLKDGSRLEGKHLLLIDDVVTTGATVIACGRTLAVIPGIRISVMSLGLTKD